MDLLLHIQAKIEKLLSDSEFKKLTKDDDAIEHVTFEESTQIAHLHNLSREPLPENEDARVQIVFSRLTPYFKQGLLLKKQGMRWFSCMAFDRGELLLDIKQEAMTIPAVRSQQVLRKNLNDKMNCLVMKPTSQYIFVFYTEIADLWLKEHIEKIHGIINRSLA